MFIAANYVNRVNYSEKQNTADDEVRVGEGELRLHQLPRVTRVEHVEDAVRVDPYRPPRVTRPRVFHCELDTKIT